MSKKILLKNDVQTEITLRSNTEYEVIEEDDNYYAVHLKNNLTYIPKLYCKVIDQTEGEQRFEDGTVVRLDPRIKGLNTLNMIGYYLPFKSYSIFLHIENNKFYRLFADFTRVEVSRVYVITFAKNYPSLIINESQMKPLIDLAICNNEQIARLNKKTGELIYKMGFMTEDVFNTIKYVSP